VQSSSVRRAGPVRRHKLVEHFNPHVLFIIGAAAVALALPS
jgi:hypothetical protein